MSALGHKRTFAAQTGMSALPPKADMCGATRYVRFVPIADIGPGSPASMTLGNMRANGVGRSPRSVSVARLQLLSGSRT